MKTSLNKELARIGNEQVKGAEYALRIKDLQGATKDYPVESKTYWSFQEKFGNLYGKTVLFRTIDGQQVRGILDNVVCVMDLSKDQL